MKRYTYVRAANVYLLVTLAIMALFVVGCSSAPERTCTVIKALACPIEETSLEE